jgi:hypothetical protein
MLLKGLAVEHPSQQLLFRLQDVQRLCHAAVRWASSKGGSRKRNSKVLPAHFQKTDETVEYE